MIGIRLSMTLDDTGGSWECCHKERHILYWKYSQEEVVEEERRQQQQQKEQGVRGRVLGVKS